MVICSRIGRNVKKVLHRSFASLKLWGCIFITCSFVYYFYLRLYIVPFRRRLSRRGNSLIKYHLHRGRLSVHDFTDGQKLIMENNHVAVINKFCNGVSNSWLSSLNSALFEPLGTENAFAICQNSTYVLHCV